MAVSNIPTALTIAGSDSGGGAGIQADLKTFAALGVFGASALTAVTAQNTLGVASVAEVPLEVISDQIDVVVSDIGADVVKTGMLSSADIVHCVADAIDRHRLSPVVVDPVMVSATGARLLSVDAVDAVRDVLMQRATVVTPNIPEAEELIGSQIGSVDDMIAAAKSLLEMGAQAAVVKGGHMGDNAQEVTDVLVDDSGVHEFKAIRLDSSNTHGTGCTFASAIAAYIAHGSDLVSAAEKAQQFVWKAILTAPNIGQGNGPLNHMHVLSHSEGTEQV